MKTMLYLLRHGETDSNVAQIYQGQGNGNLSVEGLKQAEAVSQAFSSSKIDAFYSSTLDRSFNTAEIIAKPHGSSVTKVPEMKERYYGAWEGLSFDEITRKYPKLYEKWIKDPAKARIKGAEKLKDLQKRGVRAIEGILKDNEGKTILVVGHGGINRTILFHYLGVHLNYFWRIRQNNCCVNLIEFNHFPKVVLLNCRCDIKKSVVPDVLS